MVDPGVESTRSSEMGDWGTTASDPSFLSIGANNIWAHERDGASSAATDTLVDTGTRAADICTRLPPPPIPPWLENSPERLRRFISNYSCWERYTELCSVHIPYLKSSSRAQMEDLHSNGELSDPMSRLLPFLASITVGLLMIGIIAGAYFWHQRNRRKFSQTVKYLKQPSPTRNYCAPNFYMTPSVTVETQLSLCALEDNFRIQPYSIYREEAWPYNVIDTSHSHSTKPSRSAEDSFVYENVSSSCCLRKENEILLQPNQLDENGEEPFYPSAQSLYGDALNSPSSPSDLYVREEAARNKDKHRAYQSGSRRKDKQRHALLHPNQNSVLLDSNSPYVQIQSLHDFPDSTYDECHSPLQLKRKEIPGSKRKGVVKKCKDAGNKVMARLPWKTGGVKSANHPISSSSSNRKLEGPIRVLRQSFKELRALSHRRLHQTPPSKSKHNHSRTFVPSSDSDNDHS